MKVPQVVQAFREYRQGPVTREKHESLLEIFGPWSGEGPDGRADLVAEQALHVRRRWTEVCVHGLVHGRDGEGRSR